jgi:hypothetical protein
MATPDQIHSDLTLEIGEDLSPERFMAAIRAFFGYVEEVGRALAPDGGTQDWVVHVKEGSNLIGIDPGPGAHIVIVNRVYMAVERGIRHLTAGDFDGAEVPDNALRHLKNLSELTNRTAKKPVNLRLWVQKNPTILGDEISKTIQEDWRSGYRDYGSVEGTLEAIQDRGTLQIRVRDTSMRLSINCIVPEELLDKAFSNFRKRVEVYGLINYRRNGRPVSISADRIETLWDDSALPSLEDVRGILKPDQWQPI